MKNNRFFLLWACVCIAANLFFTFSKAYEGDQGYWQNWIGQLMTKGFDGFDGNYPPVYVLWLWAVGKFYAFAELDVYKNLLLKFLCLIPVYFAHLGILQITWSWLRQKNVSDLEKHLALGFVALNPALIAVGPMWGQVDTFPLLFAMLSLSFAMKPQKAYWSFPFFIVAVLTKFQMIAFLPVLGALWLRRFKFTWKGIPLAVVVAFLLLLPFFVAGDVSRILSNAYVKSASMYPYATYNAANLWMILCGNVTLDYIPLFGLPDEGFGKFITANYVGKLIFVLFSIVVFIRALKVRNPRNAFRLATWMGLAFFIVLPEMHERYIVCAVPPSLLWLSRVKPGMYPWIAGISFVAAGNIVMINGFRGDALWFPLSLLICVLFASMVLFEIFPKIKDIVLELLRKIPSKVFVPYGLLAIFSVFFVVYQMIQMSPVSAKLAARDTLLYNLPRLSAEQGYRRPQYGLSVEGNPLTVRGRIYRDGIGAHAPSKIVFKLPLGADSLRFGYAIDGEAVSGELTFIIRLDGKIVWKSDVMRGKDAPVFTAISVRGAETVTLEQDPHGNDSNDHGDWLLPVITFLD